MSFHLVMLLQPIYFLSYLQCYIDTPDHTPTKTDARYGAPPHLKMKPHLTKKQNLPIVKPSSRKRFQEKNNILKSS